MNMRKEGGARLVGGVVAIILLSILIISGPAQAFTTGFSVLNSRVEKGEVISFTASVEIDSGEFLEIEDFVLKLEGPSEVNCKFLPDGSIISGCEGITIRLISSSPYNYGYGFSEGTFEYEILLDTGGYVVGFYETSLSVFSEGEVFSKPGENIIIGSDESLGLEKCSIRAKDGALNVEGVDLGNNNELSFYLSKGSSGLGQGFLIGQKNRKRVNYDFDVAEIIENGADRAVIRVLGDYRINIGAKKQNEAFIIFDKINDKIRLVSNELELINADVNLKKMC